MKKETLKYFVNRYAQLVKERQAIKEMKTLSFDLKEQCEKWYDNEINAIMRDPYLFDKITGAQQGGII